MKIAAPANGKNSSKPMLENDWGGTDDILGRATCTYNVDSDALDRQSTLAAKAVLISASSAYGGAYIYSKRIRSQIRSRPSRQRKEHQDHYILKIAHCYTIMLE